MGYDGFPVLRGIDFSVKKGEVFVIMGGSGCGKSTLLKAMIGL
ncbi:MAG: ATP-binding cassette domain-containing protein, partial [Candidatus Omnitrophica bacterium]|nr:ATP-binding cassette domain-containing protein [Candidatus Omnitrophota bacterium]